MDTLDKRELERLLALRELSRRNFYEFFKHFYWPVVEPYVPFIESWAHRYVCEWLQELSENKVPGNSLLLNTPPRFSKSSICTMAYPVWCWISNPGRNFLFASFNLKLSGDHARTRRECLRDKRITVLGTPKLTNNNPYNLKNVCRGTFQNLSRSKTTGSGASDLVIDDLCATTDTANQIATANELYLRGIKSRLNNSATDRKLMICQRVGVLDPAHIAEREGYHKVCLEMEASQPQLFVYPRSKKEKQVEAGDILNPGRDSREFIEALKLDAEVWATQYQQKPAPESGIIFTSESFIHTDELEPGYVIVSADTANSSKAGSAYWAIIVAHLSFDARITILAVYRDQHNYASGKQTFLGVLQSWNPDFVLIENASSGQGLLSELPLLFNGPYYVAIQPKGTKHSRAVASSAMLPVYYFSGEWVVEYLGELLPFPRSAYMDQVDATSQLLNWLRSFQLQVLTGVQLKIGSINSTKEDLIMAVYRNCVRLSAAVKQ